MGTNFYKVRTLARELKDKLIDSINNDGITVDEHGAVIFRDNNGDEINIPNLEVHIGKRLGGWKFLFDHNNWNYYPRDKEKFIKWVSDPANGRTVDEYGEEYTPEQFWEEEVMPTYTEPWIDGKDRFDSSAYNKWQKENGKPQNGINDFYLEDLRFSICTDFS